MIFSNSYPKALSSANNKASSGAVTSKISTASREGTNTTFNSVIVSSCPHADKTNTLTNNNVKLSNFFIFPPRAISSVLGAHLQ